MTKLTLVSHHLCPYVQRAAIVLLEKGVPFERRMIDLAAKPNWFLALSPLGKVPLLIVEREGSQEILFESSVIAEYLEEIHPTPALHPSDPLEKAKRRAWMEFGSTVLADIWTLETTGDPAAFEVKRSAIHAKLGRLERILHDGPYFAGAEFGLVDAVFAPAFRYFELFDTISDTGVFSGLPRVTAWRDALAARPSVIAAVEGLDYHARLRAFLERHDAYLLRRASLAAAA
jgi:glutathione S-transferase